MTVDEILDRVSWMEWDERLALFRGICSYIGEDAALQQLLERRGADIDVVLKSLPAFSSLIESGKATMAEVCSSAAAHETDARSTRSALSADPSRRLRVASWPGRHYQHNPFIPLFCEGLTAAGADVLDVRDPCDEPHPAADILHIHWPEQVFWQAGAPEQSAVAAASTLRALARWKSGGARIVWMVHNTAPHDLAPWQREIWSGFYREGLGRLCDGFLTLSPSTLTVAREAIPELRDKPGAFALHPTYPGVWRPASLRPATCARLGFPEEAKVIACLGLVRAYKGLDELVEVFRSLPDERLRLLIAGKPVPAEAADTLRALAQNDGRIRLVLSHLEVEEFCQYKAVADLIVIPFRNYLHSASLIHGISAGRTVLTPDAPFSRDLRAQFGSDRVRLYDPPLTAQALLGALAAVTTPRPAGDVNDAVITGRQALSFYDRVLAQ